MNVEIGEEEFERFIRSYIRIHQYRNKNENPKSIRLPAVFEVRGVEVVFPVKPVKGAGSGTK